MKKRRHRRATAKQLAALARGRAKLAARRAGASNPKRARRRKARRSLVSRAGKHRPVVIVKRRKLSRPKKSTIPARASFTNPFLGEIAMLGNPRKKHRRKSSNPHRRAHRRRTHRNPGVIAGTLAPVTRGAREIVSVSFLQEAGSVAVGFVLPNMVLPMLPTVMTDAKWKRYGSKVLTVSALAAVAGWAGSKRLSRAVLVGGGVSIILDLYNDLVVPALPGAAPALRDSVDAYYGEPGGMGAYYGERGGGVAEGVGTLAESFS